MDDDEIKLTKKGVALHLEEWADLYALVNTINKAYPSLANAQPCYYGDGHKNQIWWLVSGLPPISQPSK